MPDEPPFPQIVVEFYGTIRRRADCAQVVVPARTVGEALAAVRTAVPRLDGVVITGRWLQPGYQVCCNARTFPTDPEEPLQPGDHLLLLTLDMGG